MNKIFCVDWFIKTTFKKIQKFNSAEQGTCWELQETLLKVGDITEE